MSNGSRLNIDCRGYSVSWCFERSNKTDGLPKECHTSIWLKFIKSRIIIIWYTRILYKNKSTKSRLSEFFARLYIIIYNIIQYLRIKTHLWHVYSSNFCRHLTHKCSEIIFGCLLVTRMYTLKIRSCPHCLIINVNKI
jgi:hypothetical protein